MKEKYGEHLLKMQKEYVSHLIDILLFERRKKKLTN